MSSYRPLVNSFTRVFSIEGGARVDHAPVYRGCWRAGGIEQEAGDIERIECQSDEAYNEYDELGIIQGGQGRATTSVASQYPADVKSALLKMFLKRCVVDLQIHIGSCQNPTVFNDYDKAIILETTYFTNYSADELGSLSSEERAAVMENADISAKKFYEITPLSVASKASDVLTNEVIDVVVCDNKSCGDCDDESDGCQKIFALTSFAAGSPSAPADVVFNLAKGAGTWYSHDVDSMSGEAPTGLACVGSYVVVVSNASNSHHYALKSEFDGTTDPTWAEVTTGYVTAAEPNDIWSVGNSAFIVGDAGYIYLLEDPTSGVSVLDSGVAVQDDLKAVHALNSTFAVAVGNGGAIVKTENGSSWAEVSPSPVGVGVNFTCVWVKTSKEWLIGANNGNLYYTTDGGDTFSTKAFSGSGTGTVYDVAFSTPSVGYLAHTTAAARGRVFRTIDGGYSWTLVPEATGTMPLNDRIGALAVCKEDPDFFVGVGLADDATDGFIVIGAGKDQEN